MSIKEQLNNELKEAMKSKDKVRLQTIRALKSAIKYAEIDEGVELDDKATLAVIVKQAKQRRDSIEQFKKGGRQDLVDKEAAELAILEKYLPTQMSENDIKANVQKVIDELGVSGVELMGQVMKVVMADLRGKADGKLVNQIVRQLLNS